MRKVIIVRAMNLPPEGELDERLEELGPKWTVVSAKTTLTTIKPGPLAQVLFVTTVVVERTR